MASKKTTPAQQPVKRDYKIVEATIKDGLCDYAYEIIRGIGLGNVHKVKGKVGLVKDSLRKSFEALNVHLAYIDDVFKHSKQDVERLSLVTGDELTFLYNVTGFKIQGSEENESVILVGTKYLSIGGRAKFDTPRADISDSSSYKWYNELKEVITAAREEVALYHEGNYDPIDVEENEEDPNQIKMSFRSAGKDEELEKAEI